MTTVLGVGPRSWMTTERSERYVLGDPARPLLTLNAVDDQGCMWVADEPQGWDAPTVQTPIDRRQNGHGGYLGESFYEERALTFDGVCVAPSIDAARAARTRLRNAVLNNLAGLTPYWHLDDEPAKGLLVRPTGAPRMRLDGHVLTFGFVLVAEDPLKRGAEFTYGPFRLPGEVGASTGRTYARHYPYRYDSIVGAPFAGNVGDEDSHARYVLRGPIEDPLVQVGASEEWFALATDLAPANPESGLAADVAIVDTAAGTVTLNGELRYDLWVTDSTFPLIPAGGAVVRLRSRTGDSNQTGSLTVTTAPTWK